MVNRQAALSEQLLNVAVAQRIAQVPRDGLQVSDAWKRRPLKSSLERRLSRSAIALRIMGRPPTTEGKVDRHARPAVNARSLRQAPCAASEPASSRPRETS